MQNRREKEIKRTVKDSVFSALFNEPKYLRQLCKVLKPDATEEELDSISNVTIKNVLVNGLYNDLACSMGHEALFLYFCEAQSRWSNNIAYRLLEYYVEWTHDYVVKNGYNLYSRKAVPLPVPEFYVVYTGKSEQPESEITLKATNFGGREGAVEVKVKVLRMSEENNILDQYIKFARICDEQVEEKGRTKEAIEAIMRICAENDILKEFLETRKGEVVDMLDTLFDQEYAVAAYGSEEREEGRKEGRKEGMQEGIKRGKKEGLKEGMQEGRLEMLRNLMDTMGMDAKTALITLKIDGKEYDYYLSKLQ